VRSSTRPRTNGGEYTIDDAARTRLTERPERLAGSGHRILAVAERICPLWMGM
jgi:hypothetical protein